MKTISRYKIGEHRVSIHRDPDKIADESFRYAIECRGKDSGIKEFLDSLGIDTTHYRVIIHTNSVNMWADAYMLTEADLDMIRLLLSPGYWEETVTIIEMEEGTRCEYCRN